MKNETAELILNVIVAVGLVLSAIIIGFLFYLLQTQYWWVSTHLFFLNIGLLLGCRR